MRGISLLLLSAVLASCAAAPQPAARSASAQQAYETLIAGKAPGTPMQCLPNHNANDMQVIDGHTVAYRLGSRTTYIMKLTDGCNALGSSNYALLTRQFGGMGMCTGDIAQVIDTTSRMTVGSCGIEKIIPYTRPS